ncbi:helix-turn-helix domain-containing protein [Kosakonia sp. H02]|nr:helix-turn-helix domain-containing protein [Kosakonia sp. H02]
MRDFISDLLFWLEKNLEQPLSIEIIEKRAGYSRWHLQRIFREVTGIPMATYIRRRRLCKAATALKISSDSILNIALRYRFNTQQSFNRRFKDHFGMAPGIWRSEETWDFSKLAPPIKMTKPDSPAPKLREMEPCEIAVKTYERMLSLEALDNPDTMTALELTTLSAFINDTPLSEDKLFIFTNYFHVKHPGEFGVTYEFSTGNCHSVFKPNGNKLIIKKIKKGKYLSFHWQGTLSDHSRFVENIYHYALPQTSHCRRHESDINIISTHGATNIDNETILSGEYLIPVI